MRRRALLAALLALTFAAAQDKGASVPRPAAPAPAAPKPKVRIDTSYGPIVVELEPDLAPKTVANFLAYVKAGHYAGTIFHRVIPGFMIQGGGLTESMAEKPTLAPIPNEAERTFKAGLRNARGTLAMARTADPDSAMAQFYINTVDNASLDFRSATPEGIGYCAFGRVVSGMEAVDAIEKVRTVWRRGQPNVPDYPVKIKGVELLAP
jgi:cyclophilin family peptidyl-prolyl cis-trans isomerase